MYKKQYVNISSDQFAPRADSLLIKAEDMSEQTYGDLKLIASLGPKSFMDRPTQGTAVAIGSNIKDIAVGDQVFWDLANGVDFEFEDGQFVLLRYENVLCIIPT